MPPGCRPCLGLGLERTRQGWFCLSWVAGVVTFRCGLVWFGRASDKCQKEKRKTINGDDLLWAMATLGFEEYVDPLKIYLQKYRDVIMALAHYQYLLQMTIILLFCISHLTSLLLCLPCNFLDGRGDCRWRYVIL